jgi:hypothetical protein
VAQQRVPGTTSVRRPPAERALAWIYTGPLGHLWSVAADISLMWLRWTGMRLRARLGR